MDASGKKVGLLVVGTGYLGAQRAAPAVAARGASLEAGKHVLCEKPLAIDAAEARSLALLADARGVRLATGLNHRFYPPVRDAMALISAWAIGRVESVRAQIGHKADAAFLAGWH